MPVGTSIPTRPCRARVLVHVGCGSLDNEHGRLGIGVHVGRGLLDNQHGRLGITVPTGDLFAVVNFIHWWSEQSAGRLVGATSLFYDLKALIISYL